MVGMMGDRMDGGGDGGQVTCYHTARLALFLSPP